MSILTTLGINIQRARRERRLSQEDLALRSGRTRAYISGLEAGARNITVLKLESIAAALDVTIIDLLQPLWSQIDQTQKAADEPPAMPE